MMQLLYVYVCVCAYIYMCVDGTGMLGVVVVALDGTGTSRSVFV